MQTALKIRKAEESDRLVLAQTITSAFAKEFLLLTRNLAGITRLLEEGLDSTRFFIAEQDGSAGAVIACSDGTGRAVRMTRKACVRELGLLRGNIGYRIFWKMFLRPLTCSEETGYIEFVSVLENMRHQGIATHLLEHLIAHLNYKEYQLDVSDTNAVAVACYKKFGFVQIGCEPERFGKFMGYRAKLLLRYIPN